MGSVLIRMSDNTGAGVLMLELAARNAADWSVFWGDKNSALSQAWALSRREMFLTQGSSTGARWPNYSPLESKYWAPVKRAVLGVKTLDNGSILRWSRTPANSAAASGERLYPSMGYTSHPEYVYNVRGNGVEMGTRVPYARNHDKGVGAYIRKFKRKSVVIPTPRRPLTRFGDKFISDVRFALGQVVGAMDGQVGITDVELAERFRLNGGRIGL